MDKIINRLEGLEAQCTVLNEENCANKVSIKILEKKLSECEQKNKELTDQREAASSENTDEAENEKRFRNLEREIVKLRRQQQQQIQDTNNKFHKIDKLQHLFNCTMLKKAAANEKIEQVSSRLDSISDAVDDLKASRTKTEEMNSRMDSVNSRMNSVNSKMDFVNSKINSVSPKMNYVSSRMDSVDSRMNSVNSKMDSVSGTVDDLQANAGITSSQMDELTSRCTSIEKELKDLKASRTKTEKTQQAQAVSVATSKRSQALKWLRTKTRKTQQAQASSAAAATPATPVKSQSGDSPLERKFKSCMTRVRNRNVPLSKNDYDSLSALESIARIPNGPAFQFITNCLDDDSQEAESDRQDHIKKYYTKDMISTQKAMSDYVKLCDQYTCETPLASTEYHPILDRDYGNIILAIDSPGLRYLDVYTKKESKSRRWDSVAKCDIDQGGDLILTLTNGDKEEFTTYEQINPLVQATIQLLAIS